MKKRLLHLPIMMLIVVVIFAGAITAFLTSNKDIESNKIIGNVTVEISVYFEKENEQGQTIIYTEDLDYVATVGDSGSFTKFGVAQVDISHVNEIKFLKNFRVDISITSTVDTYFRVAPYEQLTLTYSVGDLNREVAVTQKSFIPFNYDPNDGFLDNRMFDGFYYYKNKVQRVSENEALKISFIGAFDESVNFRVFDPKYTLQIGFLVESVQAYLGPQIVWGMETAPWGGEW